MTATLRLVRHATLQLELGGRRLLVDPMLDAKGARPPIENTPAQRDNPLTDLPEPAEDVVGWAEAVLVTHLHEDHLDGTASALIADRLPVFGQPEDIAELHERGLRHAEAVHDRLVWDGVELTRTGGRHGTGRLAEMLAPVSGFVLRSEGAPSVYIAGDTVWCPEVEQALAEHRPDVIVLNTGGARFLEGDAITMTPEDVQTVREAAPGAQVIAVHMEAINHCVVTRADLAAALGDDQVRIPADGERLALH